MSRAGRWSRAAVEREARALCQNRRDMLREDYQRYRPKCRLEDFDRWKESLLLEQYGRAWRPAPLPRTVKRGSEGCCFQNAARLALDGPDLSYVEGYAEGNVRHAWCVNARGHVIDPTWPKDEALPRDYYGIAFRTSWIKESPFGRNHTEEDREGGALFTVWTDPPALRTKPEDMLDLRWYRLKALKPAAIK